MSTILQRRRAVGNDGDDDDRCLEEGHFGTNGNCDDDCSTQSQWPIEASCSKQWRRQWRRSSTCKKLTIIFVLKKVVVVVVFVICYLLFQDNAPTSPKLPIPNIDVEVTGADDWPLVHIVQSRFMQEQGPLEILGMARLKLFLTFCLPSMVQQTSQNFLWIIKTDPQFTKTSVFDVLIRSVRPHDNIYLVASNANFIFGSDGREGSWRDGKEANDLLQSTIYTGNITKLHIAMALRNERPILETRLDADDGLHKQFIEYIQHTALKRFQPSKDDEDAEDGNIIPRWLYWCSRRHIEWHSDTDASVPDEEKRRIGSPGLGYMNVVQHNKLCVTPGITVGYNVGTDKKSNNIVDVPQYDHDKLYKNVRNSLDCYSTNDRKNIPDAAEDETNGSCLELVEDFLFCAIRSRTWTSAGMLGVNLVSDNVLFGGDGDRQEDFGRMVWSFSEDAFSVTEAKVEETQRFLIENKKRIAHENLLGQCSSGHSCKDTAKKELQQIIDDLERKHKG